MILIQFANIVSSIQHLLKFNSLTCKGAKSDIASIWSKVDCSSLSPFFKIRGIAWAPPWTILWATTWILSTQSTSAQYDAANLPFDLSLPFPSCPLPTISSFIIAFKICSKTSSYLVDEETEIDLWVDKEFFR